MSYDIFMSLAELFPIIFEFEWNLNKTIQNVD